MSIELTCNAFESGGTIPQEYTCDGRNISPPLQWRFIPENTKSFVLVADDPDATGGTFVHWVLYNIPPDVDGLSENIPTGGEPGFGGLQGRNDFGNNQYDGPCPPRGETHTYYFRLYALDKELDALAGATRAQVMDLMRDHILDQTELLASYTRT